MEQLDNLKVPCSKMLYIITMLSKSEKIDKTQRIKLKEMVIKDDPIIMNAYNDYDKAKDIDDFITQLIALVPIVNEDPNTTPKPKEVTDPSSQNKEKLAQETSPIGAELMKHKKKFVNEVKQPVLSKQEASSVKKCDLGKSPEQIKFNFKDKLTKS